MLGFRTNHRRQRTLLDLIAEDAFKPPQQRQAELAMAYEELLDTVWALERAWAFEHGIRDQSA